MAIRILFSLVFFLILNGVLHSTTPDIPSGIDHQPWDALLQKYVDEEGLVDYSSWKNSEEDQRKLDGYLAQFAPATDAMDAAADGDAWIAALINAYNAFTIQFILENYPTESIRLLPDPFDGKRHLLGGEIVSVDDIEHAMLRPVIGWKVHAVVVCAARSCPPLLNRAYLPDSWEAQMEERYRTWLAREDLHTFETDRGRRGRVTISRIFQWYADDYEGDHSVEVILQKYGPRPYQAFLQGGGYRIRFKDYHWGLNDQSDLGKDYRHSFLRSLF